MSFRFKLNIEHYETGKSIVLLNEVGHLMDEPVDLIDALSVFLSEFDKDEIVKAWESYNDVIKNDI